MHADSKVNIHSRGSSQGEGCVRMDLKKYSCVFIMLLSCSHMFPMMFLKFSMGPHDVPQGCFQHHHILCPKFSLSDKGIEGESLLPSKDSFFWFYCDDVPIKMANC
jgi:hypothetical protein